MSQAIFSRFLILSQASLAMFLTCPHPPFQSPLMISENKPNISPIPLSPFSIMPLINFQISSTICMISPPYRSQNFLMLFQVRAIPLPISPMNQVTRPHSHVTTVITSAPCSSHHCFIPPNKRCTVSESHCLKSSHFCLTHSRAFGAFVLNHSEKASHLPRSQSTIGPMAILNRSQASLRRSI